MSSLALNKSRGIRSPYAILERYSGSDPRLVNTGQPFTVTNINVTPVIAYNDTLNLPVVQMAGAGAATDAHQHQISDAGYQLEAGKEFSFYTELGSADITNHEFFAGLAALDSTIIAGCSDFIGVRKLTGETRFKVVARKASGTEEAYFLNMPAVVANDVLYCFEVVVLPDSATAGKAKVTVYCGVNLAANGQMSVVFDETIQTQAPDTVDMSMARAWRAGTAVTTAGFFGAIEWQAAA